LLLGIGDPLSTTCWDVRTPFFTPLNCGPPNLVHAFCQSFLSCAYASIDFLGRVYVQLTSFRDLPITWLPWLSKLLWTWRNCLLMDSFSSLLSHVISRELIIGCILLLQGIVMVLILNMNLDVDLESELICTHQILLAHSITILVLYNLCVCHLASRWTGLGIWPDSSVQVVWLSSRCDSLWFFRYRVSSHAMSRSSGCS
jgi:hypothetical protein